jgi:hypothetical protein
MKYNRINNNNNSSTNNNNNNNSSRLNNNRYDVVILRMCWVDIMACYLRVHIFLDRHERSRNMCPSIFYWFKNENNFSNIRLAVVDEVTLKRRPTTPSSLVTDKVFQGISIRWIRWYHLGKLNLISSVTIK